VIGRLKGVLVHKQPPWLVVDVHGVGYELEAPMSTFYDLPAVGGDVALFTHHAQKEDSVALYGFLREAERRLFRDVQKVSGIGAKIALAVLSGVSVDDFARLVQTGDIAALTRVPGIGKKNCRADGGGAARPRLGLRQRRDRRRRKRAVGSAIRSRQRVAAAGLQAGGSGTDGTGGFCGRRRCRVHHPPRPTVRAPLTPARFRQPA